MAFGFFGKVNDGDQCHQLCQATRLWVDGHAGNHQWSIPQPWWVDLVHAAAFVINVSPKFNNFTWNWRVGTRSFPSQPIFRVSGRVSFGSALNNQRHSTFLRFRTHEREVQWVGEGVFYLRFCCEHFGLDLVQFLGFRPEPWDESFLDIRKWFCAKSRCVSESADLIFWNLCHPEGLGACPREGGKSTEIYITCIHIYIYIHMHTCGVSGNAKAHNTYVHNCTYIHV